MPICITCRAAFVSAIGFRSSFPLATLAGTTMKLFAAFFAFGTTMCALTIVLLLFPGTNLDSLWRLNPDAHLAFQAIGKVAVLIMLVVGTGCSLAAIGLWRGTLWGVRVAIVVLSVNIIGDLVNAVVRHDYRALIGLPIAGAMIYYLARHARADRTSSS